VTTHGPVHCIECDEPISPDARACPECGALQPSKLMTVLGVAVGVFAFLFGFLIGVFTYGLSMFVGYAVALVGVGLAIGSYTRYLDYRAQRAGRAR